MNFRSQLLLVTISLVLGNSLNSYSGDEINSGYEISLPPKGEVAAVPPSFSLGTADPFDRDFDNYKGEGRQSVTESTSEGQMIDGVGSSFNRKSVKGYNYKAKPKPQLQHGDFKKLIFEDEFNTLDFNKWRQEITAGGGGNWEYQFYNNDRRTSFIKDGKLHMKPILTSEYLGISDEQLMKESKLDLWGNAPGMQCTAHLFDGCIRETKNNSIINPIMSSQVRSVNSFSFTYGKVDIVAKMPKGDWIWPAIWLLPKHHAYGGWPASGEIDIIESRGNSNDCYGDGVSTVSSALHWGLNYTNNKYDLTNGKYKIPQGTFNDDFHKFTLEWTPKYIRTWVDDKHLIMDIPFNQPMHKFGNYTGSYNPWDGRLNNAPFDQEFYLIFNVAVGGTNGFFSDGPDPKKEPKLANKCKTQPKKSLKPWKNSSESGPKDFLTNKNQWLPT